MLKRSRLPPSPPEHPSLDAKGRRGHSWLAAPSKRAAGGLWLGLLAWALWLSGVGRQPLVNWGGWSVMAQFWIAMAHPALEADFVQVIVKATAITFAFAICGTALSLVMGFIAGVACSRLWWQRVWPGLSGQLIWLGLRGLLAIPRAIHELIWGLLLLSLLGLDPWVGVLAIAIPFGAITAKVFADILDETSPAPLDALVHSGVSPGVAFLYGLLPQALPNLISYGFYRFECSLRSAAVLGVIGAGGLGYEIFLSLKSLQYEQLWTGFYALIALNGTVDFGSGWLRRQLGFVGRMDISSPVGQPQLAAEKPKSRFRPLLVMVSGGGMALVVPLCIAYLQWALPFKPWGDWQRWLAVRSRLIELTAQLSPAQVLPEFSWQLLPLSLQTVAMSVLAITLAGIGGSLLSFPAAQNVLLPGGVLFPVNLSASSPLWQQLMQLPGRSRQGWASLRPAIRQVLGQVLPWGVMLAVRGGLLVARAIPAPILALVILYGMFPGILPGALALGIHNLGILGRLMAEANENVPDAPLRALRSLGASGGSLIAYGLLPANLARFLAYSLYRWEVCLRETVIVGLVGASGLGRLLTEQLSSFDYSGLAATLSVFVILTFGVDMVSEWMRRAIR